MSNIDIEIYFSQFKEFFKENPRFISDGGSSYKSFATFISDLIANDSIDDLFEDTYYYYAIKDPKNIYSIL